MSLLAGRAMPGRHASRRDAEPPEASVPLRPLRILLAEDNVVNQKVAQLLLAKLEQRADLATNGGEAVSALERRDYDLVLMDCEMPEMDGYEATRAIRARIPVERQPYIVAMTAHALEGARETCLAAGMDDYIPKPVDRNRLRAILALLAASTSAGSGECDHAALDPLREDLGADSMAEVVDAIIKDAPQQLDELARALERKDAAGLRRVAHTMKSNSALVGAEALGALLQELEQLAASGSTDAAAETAARAGARYRDLVRKLAAGPAI